MERLWARLRAAATLPVLAGLLAAFLLIAGVRFSVGGSEAHQLEKRLEKTLSRVEGAGRVEVVIRTKTIYGETGGAVLSSGAQSKQVPCGAIAVAQGAGDPMVKHALMQALCALLGLQAAQVDVLISSGG